MAAGACIDDDDDVGVCVDAAVDCVLSWYTLGLPSSGALER